MRILAIDTATEACSAAVLDEGRMALRYAELGRGHAEHILGMVDQVLAEMGLQLSELDALAFGRGPGAFTGARLAASVAQGLAFGASLRVIPVSDLQALGQRALDESSDAARGVIAASDARMGEVYWACYGRGAKGTAEPVGPERIGPPEAVVLPAGLPTPVTAVGRAFRAYPQLRAQLQAHLNGVRDDLLPRAAEVARLAALELAAGRTLAPEEARPVYLRDEVATPRPSRD
jgi:tRNA threonylcarbamoyladenosine biosynthesis protein TsaB